MNIILTGWALILVLLAGCQAQEQPSEPATTPTPSPSIPTPSDDLPEIPEVATQKSREGAAAFARHYYALINYGRATDDWKPAKDVTLPSCKQCEDFWSDEPSRMDNNRRIYIRNKLETGRFDDPKTSVGLLITSEVDPDDIPTESGLEWTDLLWLDYRNGRWMVENLEFSDRWPKSSE